MAAQDTPHSQTTTRPDPDPTILTTAALLREIASVKELFDAKLAAMGKTMDDIHQNLHAVPLERAKDIAALQALIEQQFITMEEKFHSVQTQFTERDIRVEQTAKDSKVAVDAALQAAKEAVGEQNKSSGLSIAKSEAATNKQIEQQAVLISTTNSGITNTIADLKERISKLESVSINMRDTRVDARATSTNIAQIVGVVAAIVLGVGSLVISLVVSFAHTVK